MLITLPSFAKVNLTLRVLGKRDTGFHDLFTVFQTVSLHDDIELSAATGSRLEIECDDPAVPLDESNLVARAAQMLAEAAGVRPAARISIRKRIPLGGGLGGGSSNAACALIGLSRLWNISLPEAELSRIAAKLGSDVPFFLMGGTAIGTGRGTDLESVEAFTADPMLIVTPDEHISTADVYGSLNAERLTNEAANRILRVCRNEAISHGFSLSAAQNDLEKVVFERCPQVARVKKRLLEVGASIALMSGSGASVFAVFDKEETRRSAIKALDDQVNWRKFAVAAISREEYRARLGSQKA